MSVEMFLYLAELSGRISFVSIFIMIAFCVLAMVLLACLWDDKIRKSEEEIKSYIFGAKLFFSLSFVFLIFAIFLPSKNTMYAMGAAHYSKEVGLNKTAEKALKLLDSKIDEALKDNSKD